MTKYSPDNIVKVKDAYLSLQKKGKSNPSANDVIKESGTDLGVTSVNAYLNQLNKLGIIKYSPGENLTKFKTGSYKKTRVQNPFEVLCEFLKLYTGKPLTNRALAKKTGVPKGTVTYYGKDLRTIFSTRMTGHRNTAGLKEGLVSPKKKVVAVEKIAEGVKELIINIKLNITSDGKVMVGQLNKDSCGH